ncbi:MAG: type II toxin-antitoxin system HicA family toxin [Acidobacteria bacterium]|nr:type II toxin-antitoxin system HicA family toxin [Acidobacteriota bacterium]
MSVLPRVSGREVVKALLKIGYEQDRQRGSHIILRQAAAPHRRLVVPDHNEVAKGTLRAIIRQAGLTVDEFKALL